MKFYKFLLLAFFFASFAAPTLSPASTLQCSSIFSQQAPLSFKQKVKKYGREVVETKGVRLFLKETEFDTDDTKWGGFLTKEKLDVKKTGFGYYWDAIASYVPRKLGAKFSREEGYVFTPFAGTYVTTFKKPVEYLTKKFSNRKLQPAFFFKFPAIMALTISALHVGDVYYQDRLQAHITQEISQHALQYDKLIQSDFRYASVKEGLKKGTLSKEAAQKEAYLIGLAYSYYFEFRDSMKKTPSLKTEMKLIDHYLFSHLKEVVENGVYKAEIDEGYYVPDSSVGKLHAQQILELFANNHQRYLKYQIIAEMVEQTPLWTQMRAHPNMLKLINSIANDPFTIQLYQLRDAKKISTAELTSYLQEDVYWQNRFQDWKTIGVTRLKKVDGAYINQPLTLSDIREEVLVEIANHL